MESAYADRITASYRAAAQTLRVSEGTIRRAVRHDTTRRLMPP